MPIAGIGQGNGAGLHIWVVVSSPLFEIMQSDGFFAIIQCTMLLHHNDTVGFAFMDDTDLCVLVTAESQGNISQHVQ